MCLMGAQEPERTKSVYAIDEKNLRSFLLELHGSSNAHESGGGWYSLG